MNSHYEILVVGTSWGGLAALKELLSGFAADFALPIVVVQHRHKDSNQLLGALIQERTALQVTEVEDKTPIHPGAVYIAPPDYHLLVERGTLALSVDEPVRFSRPSIDVMFESAADAYGEHVVGVILTGANSDGALGLRRIAERGGVAVVQDPATAESPAMPAAALRAVSTARVMPIPEIVRFLSVLGAPAIAPTESGI